VAESITFGIHSTDPLLDRRNKLYRRRSTFINGLVLSSPSYNPGLTGRRHPEGQRRAVRVVVARAPGSRELLNDWPGLDFLRRSWQQTPKVWALCRLIRTVAKKAVDRTVEDVRRLVRGRTSGDEKLVCACQRARACVCVYVVRGSFVTIVR